MSNDYWKEALAAARSERNKLIVRRHELGAEIVVLDDRVLQLEQTIESLSVLVGETESYSSFANKKLRDSIKDTGLADSCREVLKSSTKFLTPIMVRDTLLEQGYELSGYNNALASIHSVLKRLSQSGEAVQSSDTNGAAVYRWNTSEFKHSPLKHLGDAKFRENSPTPTARAIPQRSRPIPTRERPAWYEKITENGTKPLDFSKLTRGQQQEAKELGLAPERPKTAKEIIANALQDAIHPKK